MALNNILTTCEVQTRIHENKIAKCNVNAHNRRTYVMLPSALHEGQAPHCSSPKINSTRM